MNLLIPNDGTLNILLSDHCFNRLGYCHLVIQDHDLPVVWEEISNCVLLVKGSNIALHSVDDFFLFRQSFVFLALINFLYSIAHIIYRIFAALGVFLNATIIKQGLIVSCVLIFVMVSS